MIKILEVSTKTCSAEALPFFRRLVIDFNVDYPIDEKRILQQLQELRKAGLYASEKLVFTFSGSDTRKMWEIPEVRTIIQKVYELFPELLFYLHPAYQNSALMCLADVVFVGRIGSIFAQTEKNYRLMHRRNGQ